MALLATGVPNLAFLSIPLVWKPFSLLKNSEASTGKKAGHDSPRSRDHRRTLVQIHAPLLNAMDLDNVAFSSFQPLEQ